MTSGLLIVVVVLLIGIVIFQVARANEFMSILKGEHEGDVSPLATRIMAFFFLGFVALGIAGTFLGYEVYKAKFLPDASSVHGKELDRMFWMTTYATGIVFFITQALLFWFAFRYRSGEGNPGYYFPHSNRLEIVWTTVPAIVMTVLVIFGLRAWLDATGPAPEATMQMEALAEQFNWNIRYAGEDNKLGNRKPELITPLNAFGIDTTDPASKDDIIVREIHLPVNKPVLFRLGAKEVLHSFFIPHFRVKLDCVPGIPTQFWFTPTQTSAEMQVAVNDAKFTYFLACAELCGTSHWGMRRDIIVESEEEFKEWLAKQPTYYSTLTTSVKDPNTTDIQQITLVNAEQKDAQATPAP